MKEQEAIKPTKYIQEYKLMQRFTNPKSKGPKLLRKIEMMSTHNNKDFFGQINGFVSKAQPIFCSFKSCIKTGRT